MKATIEEEDDLAAAHDEARGADRELTLSSTTLLGIFFGLVLLCGLFFGLGYTLGRRSPAPAGPDSTIAQSVTSTASTPLPTESKPKPSATTQSQPDQTQTQSAADVPATDPTQAFPPDSASPAPAKTQDVALQVAGKNSAAPPTPVAATVQTVPSTAAATGIMVQIAAISNPADADVLVSALRKHGYSVNVRHEPSDALLHVQVGPFATKAEAVAMRQKLLSDGYNAILK